MLRSLRTVVAAMVLALGVCSGAVAFTLPAYRFASLPAVAPVVSCERLASVDLAPATGAATRQTARAVAGPHPYCAVTGTIAPTISFEVRLPLAGWTQRFLQTGCGGLCGSLRIEAEKAEGCAPVIDGGVVLASTDMGHRGMDTAWGDDPQKRIDFAHRGVHVTALAAKALIHAFYGQTPRYSYFSGCSDGGREALMEAQRYPNDFDGIAAGAPALNFTIQNSFHHAWLAKANTGRDGKPLLTAVDMPPLHAAVLKACDALDGLVDGQITDPRSCHVDPAVVQCSGAYRAGHCLTAAQVAAVRKIYAGAIGPNGEKLEVGPLMPGGELEWIGVFVPKERDMPIMSAMFALDTINHLLFMPNPNPPYTIADFPFDEAMFAREDKARKLYSADDPDLRPFARHGGKLILWHGWSDPHISPLNTIDYFSRVGRVMGPGARDQAVRLFLLPGMGHCEGGDGPSEFPLLAALMSWVETGTAPQMMIARRGAPSRMGASGDTTEHRPPPEIMRMLAIRPILPPRERPVYAYPQVARYGGRGSVDTAASFDIFTPPPSDGAAIWIGAQQ